MYLAVPSPWNFSIHAAFGRVIPGSVHTTGHGSWKCIHTVVLGISPTIVAAWFLEIWRCIAPAVAGTVLGSVPTIVCEVLPKNIIVVVVAWFLEVYVTSGFWRCAYRCSHGCWKSKYLPSSWKLILGRVPTAVVMALGSAPTVVPGS